MEVSSSNQTYQSRYLENQYGRSSLVPPAFNAINHAILNVETNLSESAIDFIHFSFKKIQIARVEALIKGDLKVRTTLKNVQTNGFNRYVQSFFNDKFQIELEWLSPSNDCYQLDIYASINAPCFFGKLSSYAKQLISQEEFSSQKSTQNVPFSIDYLIGIFSKNERLNENFASKVNLLIREIFEKQRVKRNKAQKLNLSDVCFTTIIKDSLMYPASYLSNISLVSTITLFFKSYLGMGVEAVRLTGHFTDFTLTTEINNPCFEPVNPKPMLLPFIIDRTNSFNGLQYFNDLKFTDITFIFEDGKEVKAHKIILSASPVLEKMFTIEFKSENAIPFHLCEYDTFLAFKQFIYSENVETSYLEDYQNCLNLISLAHKINYLPLALYAKNVVKDKINKETFAEIASLAAQINDDYLLGLCKWFAVDEPEFGEELEFLNFPLGELSILLQSVVKNYNLPKLKKTLIETFKSSLKLDQEFLKICNLIYETKDSEFKLILQDSLVEKPELLKTLRENKHEKEYCDLWIGFQKLFTAIEI
ncbi:MAG: BTB/POZ domain-containing protein [Parachlamydiaceae bacterium]|nr:BTB/POZ domain-containing protein [Parachlamydiaceae bacterium]